MFEAVHLLRLELHVGRADAAIQGQKTMTHVLGL